MPLLHTWSLGVEEQFYVIWPGLLIILVGLSRMMKIPVLIFISAIIAASFAAFFLITESDAFYLPYSRAWELGLGRRLASCLRSPSSVFPASKSCFRGLDLR